MSITGLDQEIEMITITCTTIMDEHKKQNFIVFVHTSVKRGEASAAGWTDIFDLSVTDGGSCRAMRTEPAS